MNEETIRAITGWESERPFEVLEGFHHMEFFRGGEWVFSHNESYSVTFDLPDDELAALARVLEEECFGPGVIGRLPEQPG